MEGGDAGEIASNDIQCGVDKFENAIKEFGVVAACEWFGHDKDSDFTKETIRILTLEAAIRGCEEHEKETL